MNKIIKNALILAAITLIAGLLLGAAHQVTLEPIQKQQEKEKQESCQNVFPEAASFEEVTMSDAEQAELTAALIGHGSSLLCRIAFAIGARAVSSASTNKILL